MREKIPEHDEPNGEDARNRRQRSQARGQSHLLKKLFKYVVAPGAALAFLAVTALVILRLSWQQRTAAQIRVAAPPGIASLEKIRLAGLDQWIHIRGHDRAKPLLLFLHGGPGFPQMPFAHLNAELEKHFVVVHWDQRGAGKSYSSAIPDDTMKVEQFVADTRELAQLLLQRFGAE